MKMYWILLTFHSVLLLAVDATKNWEQWWAYEGISGPAFWGSGAQGAWALCNKGKFQSPIDIQPRSLIYDPNLRPLHIDTNRVDGTLTNTGHDLTYELRKEADSPTFSFQGGPLSYTYRVHNIKLHFGIDDDRGSEHTISGKQFPLEVQILGYNTDLYENCSQALMSTHGLAVISVLGIIDDTKNAEFALFIEAAKFIQAKGLSSDISSFALADLIPPSDFYITYEGSITQPSCQETVTWILINKPLHITKDQIEALRKLNRLSVSETQNQARVPLMENNFRPPMPLNRRPVRTNISPFGKNEDCAVKKYTYYKVNERLIGV